jgi:hypothetical protein
LKKLILRLSAVFSVVAIGILIAIPVYADRDYHIDSDTESIGSTTLLGYSEVEIVDVYDYDGESFSGTYQYVDTISLNSKGQEWCIVAVIDTDWNEGIFDVHGAPSNKTHTDLGVGILGTCAWASPWHGNHPLLVVTSDHWAYEDDDDVHFVTQAWVWSQS